jgi:hypothetical protein
MQTPQNYYNSLDDVQLINLARLHVDRFNQAWLVVMSNHYQSGTYIDADVKMNREYSILGELERYIYNSRPSALHDAFLTLNT